MTPAERKALVFLAAVAALGAATRAVRAPRSDVRPPETRAALARQIARVDSARRAGRPRRSGRRAAATPAGAPPTQPPRGSAPRGADGGRRSSEERGTAVPVVDLDVAGAAEIERLPRLGPALARRVVADRDSNGPYGSLRALERVRGIGPGVARTLAPHVTFSGTPRPRIAEPDRGADGARASSRRVRSPGFHHTSPR